VRILAISDIHNNVPSVRKLRAQETDRFDVIAIAGDIGSDRAAEIFAVLKTFGCPIVYVTGNWDRRLSQARAFGDECHLIHLDPVNIGTLIFTGFGWRQSDLHASYREYAEHCQTALLKRLRAAGADPKRTVLITHDRVRNLEKRFPGLLLHLHGHIHTFDVFQRGATICVNSSALDRMRAVSRPHALPGSPAQDDVRYANAGNYAVIEVGEGGGVLVECRLLRRAYTDWAVLAPPSMMDGMCGALIPEEAAFGDNGRRFKPSRSGIRPR